MCAVLLVELLTTVVLCMPDISVFINACQIFCINASYAKFAGHICFWDLFCNNM